MLTTDLFSNIESILKTPLESFFLSIYEEGILVSHGLDHHRRVWAFAKEILTAEKMERDEEFISKLIITCYLHDVGMSEDPGPRHGHLSRTLCEKFLESRQLPVKDHSDVLQAIEHHDDKDYKVRTRNNELLTILSVADDLDAFGYIGIYRYAEIYLRRSVPFESLGNEILKNAGKRLENFRSSYGGNHDLFIKHHTRYSILSDFFENYNSQITGYYFGKAEPSGYCGVIELLGRIPDIHADGITSSKDPVDPFIITFFNSLHRELKLFA